MFSDRRNSLNKVCVAGFSVVSLFAVACVWGFFGWSRENGAGERTSREKEMGSAKTQSTK